MHVCSTYLEHSCKNLKLPRSGLIKGSISAIKLFPHLSKVVDEHQEDWNHCMPLFMLVYRSSIHESTHHTPAKVIFGHELGLSWDMEFGAPPEKPMPINEFVMEMWNNLRSTYKTVRNGLHLAWDQMKTCSNMSVNSLGYSVVEHICCTTKLTRKDAAPTCSETEVDLMRSQIHWIMSCIVSIN